MPSPHWTRAVWVSRRPLSAKTALIWMRRCEFLSMRNGETDGRALVTVTVESSLPVSPAASATARLRVRLASSRPLNLGSAMSELLSSLPAPVHR